MKKNYMTRMAASALVMLCSLPTMAQLNGTGFYRFRNADRTGEYISLTNDKFNFTTAISTACGGLSKASSSDGQARALECVGKYLQTDIHMVEDAECIDPAAVIYAKKKNTNTSNYDYIRPRRRGLPFLRRLRGQRRRRRLPFRQEKRTRSTCRSPSRRNADSDG